MLRSTDGGRTFEESIDLLEQTGMAPVVGRRDVAPSSAGLNIGDLVAVGWDDALLGGPWAVARRETTP